MDHLHRSRLDHSFKRFFSAALRVSFRNIRYVPFFLGAALRQRRFARLRQRNAEKKGIAVPPVLIASITESCNLACAGCYHRALHRDSSGELPASRLKSVLREAEGLGIGIALLAGGEPFARPDFFDIADASRRMLFPVFTNGFLLDKARIAKLKRRPNLVPVISLEGGEERTDARRGAGTYAKLTDVRKRLKEGGVLFGHSITVSSENLDEVTDAAFLKGLMSGGASFFVFVEYVPIKAGTEALLLGDSGRIRLRERLELLRRATGALMLAFPGDEEAFGGCLAGGRGFIHVNPRGGLEPCPFAPFSDTSLETGSLAEALASPFLERIRQGHAALTETGGCALWANKEWTAEMLRGGETEEKEVAAV
jgi:MoaA/NifB/PqqE/SkfB family radical SAM enzyme